MRTVFFLGILLTIIKVIAWERTRSNSILTDAGESIVNLLAGAMAWYSLRLSARPADQDHPYGHGKVQFISAGLEGGMIAVAGLSMAAKAIHDLWANGYVPKSLDVGLWLTLAAGAANGLMGYYLLRKSRESGSQAMAANGKHLISDAVSSAGLLSGLILIMVFRKPWMDSSLSLLFSAYLIWQGLRIVRSSVAGVMDEADSKLIGRAVTAIAAHRRDDWIDMHNLRLIQYGTALHVDAHLTVPYYYTVREAHDAIDELKVTIPDSRKGGVEFFIHTDPCEPPENCRICPMKHCPVRERPLEALREWTPELVMRNARHHSTRH